MYIFTTCAAIQANLVKINQKMGMFPAISAICKTLPQNMANGKSKQGAVRRTCLQVLLAKHEVTSIDLKCCDRHAEIQKYRVSYKLLAQIGIALDDLAGKVSLFKLKKWCIF